MKRALFNQEKISRKKSNQNCHDQEDEGKKLPFWVHLQSLRENVNEGLQLPPSVRVQEQVETQPSKNEHTSISLKNFKKLVSCGLKTDKSEKKATPRKDSGLMDTRTSHQENRMNFSPLTTPYDFVQPERSSIETLNDNSSPSDFGTCNANNITKKNFRDPIQNDFVSKHRKILQLNNSSGTHSKEYTKCISETETPFTRNVHNIFKRMKCRLKPKTDEKDSPIIVKRMKIPPDSKNTMWVCDICFVRNNGNHKRCNSCSSLRFIKQCNALKFPFKRCSERQESDYCSSVKKAKPDTNDDQKTELSTSLTTTWTNTSLENFFNYNAQLGKSENSTMIQTPTVQLHSESETLLSKDLRYNPCGFIVSDVFQPPNILDHEPAFQENQNVFISDHLQETTSVFNERFKCIKSSLNSPFRKLVTTANSSESMILQKDTETDTSNRSTEYGMESKNATPSEKEEDKYTLLEYLSCSPSLDIPLEMQTTPSVSQDDVNHFTPNFQMNVPTTFNFGAPRNSASKPFIFQGLNSCTSITSRVSRVKKRKIGTRKKSKN